LSPGRRSRGASERAPSPRHRPPSPRPPCDARRHPLPRPTDQVLEVVRLLHGWLSRPAPTWSAGATGGRPPSSSSFTATTPTARAIGRGAADRDACRPTRAVPSSGLR
jgi:hypothetical protein